MKLLFPSKQILQSSVYRYKNGNVLSTLENKVTYVAVILGSIVFILLITIIVLIFRRRVRKRSKERSRMKYVISIFTIRRRRDHAKYDLDQAKIFLYIRRGLRQKIVTTKQFDWTSSTALCKLIGQSVAPDRHAHLRMFECSTLALMPQLL